MNFKIDCNLLESLVKTSQTRDLADDPVKKTIRTGLGSSCTIYVRSGKKNWSGSGFYVGNNIVITAGHVVPNDQNLTEIMCTFDGNKYIRATFVTSDPNIDSGAVRLEYSPTGIEPLKFGNSDILEVGDIVAVISAPEGFHDTATVGRVSNIHQSIADPNMPAWNDIIFIDADILEGSSGGMVIGIDNLVYGTIMGVTGQHADIGIGESSVCPSNKIQNMLSNLV
jgi:S1-C subfamily serine protease